MGARLAAAISEDPAGLFQITEVKRGRIPKGKAVPKSTLNKVAAYLERNNIELIVDSARVPEGAIGAFRVFESPVNGYVAQVVLQSKPRIGTFYHELGHAMQHINLGHDTYLGFTKFQREQFVYLFMKGTDIDGGAIWRKLSSQEKKHITKHFVANHGDLKRIRNPRALWSPDGILAAEVYDSSDIFWDNGTQSWKWTDD